MIVTPQVFGSVYLSIDKEDVIKAQHVLDKYASAINTIVLCPMFFGYLVKEKYRDWVKRRFGLPGPLTYNSCFEEHINMSYETLNTARDMTRNSDLLQSILRAILNEAPNVKRVVMTDQKRSQDFNLAGYCCRQDCIIPAGQHRIFYPAPMANILVTTKFAQHTQSEERVIKSVLDAVSDSGRKLRELIVEYRKPWDSGVQTAMYPFLSFTEQLIQRTDLMSNLTTLKLCVDDHKLGSKGYCQRIRSNFSTRMVAKNLICAKNLQRLSLTLINCYIEDYYDLAPSIFHYLLHGCCFPKLQILVLDDCAMGCNEFMDFLETSPQLRCLVLASCALKWGESWTTLAELIKAKTHLTSLSMDHVRGPLRDGPELSARYFDHDGGLEKFMFHGGPNPFACEPDSSSGSGWWEQWERIWQAPTPAAKAECERKLAWYHRKYF